MDINHYTTIKRAKEFDIPIKDAIEKRIDYLHEELDGYQSIYNTLETMIDIVFIHRQMETIINEIQYLRQYKEPDPKDDRAITQERIDAANSVPIESIIEFNNGKAHAFCHEDKNPSLSKHPSKNYARCFVCNESYGPIKAYMEIYNVSFPEAVRALT